MKGGAKVLLIGDFPPPQGGVAVHVKQLAEYLEQHGATVHVLDIGKGGHSLSFVTPARTPAALAREVRRFARDGYTIHLHTSGNNRKSWLVALAVAQLSGSAPRVLTVHSGLSASFLASGMLHRGLALAACVSYDRVVAVSEAVADALADASVPRDLMFVQPAFVPSAVRVGKVPEGFEAARARRAPLLAFAHHPSRTYGRDILFRAVRELSYRYPDVGVAVYGPGTHDEAFREDARAAGVAGLIENFGELEHGEALAIAQAADVFVRPTRADGDAVSVREALMLGTPCVASDASARPEGVKTFRSGDGRALCDAISEALHTDPLPRAQPDAGAELLSLYRDLDVPRPGFRFFPVVSQA